MNKEMLHRMKTAGEYQRKAIRALFPEELSGHIDVIENELKIMLMELVTELMNDSRKESTSEELHKEKNSFKAKRVDIV